MHPTPLKNIKSELFQVTFELQVFNCADLQFRSPPWRVAAGRATTQAHQP